MPAGRPGNDLLDAYREAGEPLPAIPVARGLGLGFDEPVIVRDLPQTAAAEPLDPGVVLLVTGCVSDDTVGSVVTHEAIHVTADGPEVLIESVLEPSAIRSPAMTDRKPTPKPTGSSTRRTRRPRSRRSR